MPDRRWGGMHPPILPLDPPMSSATGSEQKCSKLQNVKREEPRKHQKAALMWTQVDLTSSEALFPEADYSALRLLSPVDLFEVLFSDDVWKLIVSECTCYALFLNCADPKVTIEEMKVFISILIVSGYNVLPGKRYYWESSTDVRNELIYHSMRRDRFIQIMRFLHFTDNTQPDRLHQTKCGSLGR